MTQARELEARLSDGRRKMASGSYLRNAWYVAGWSDELADGQLLARTILKEQIVLYRKSNGDVAALQDRCAHRFAPLHMGKIVKGDRIQCAYHGLEFDGTGRLRPQSAWQQEHSLTRAGAQLSGHGKAQGDLGLDGRQGAGRIEGPGLHVLDNVPESHTTKRDGFTIKANYELIVDNLLDLSHTSFLHDGILGNADTVESDITRRT